MDAAASASQSRGAPPHFPLFPLLPAEIRLRIWQDSCLPRVLELHAPQIHYADHGGAATTSTPQPPAFQSRSRNPALLSVSTEARAAALAVYAVALPLASEKKGRDLVLDAHRVLYVALDRDAVVLLGMEPAGRVTQLVGWFRESDRGRRSAEGSAARGLRSIGVSATHFAHGHGAAMLRVIGKTLFRDLESFALVIGGAGVAKAPPLWWGGGQCRFREFESGAGGEGGDDLCQEFLTGGGGAQFRELDGWMVVGRNVMKVVDIYFEDGW